MSSADFFYGNFSYVYRKSGRVMYLSKLYTVPQHSTHNISEHGRLQSNFENREFPKKR